MTASSGVLGLTSGDEECPENVHEGDLNVFEDTDLSELSSLTGVTGKLAVLGRANVGPDLSFLGCLREAERLEISSNRIVNLEGLGRLETVSSLVVKNNAVLRSLDGLTSLRHAGGIGLSGNPQLATLGLDQLESATNLGIGLCGGYTPAGGNGLTDITGLSSMTEIGVLSIRGNDDLVSVDGLRTLVGNGTTIDSLLIDHNRNLLTAEAEAMAEMLGIGEEDRVICGNKGDEHPWDELEPEGYCWCGIGE